MKTVLKVVTSALATIAVLFLVSPWLVQAYMAYSLAVMCFLGNGWVCR
jgi:hypothetical protein